MRVYCTNPKCPNHERKREFHQNLLENSLEQRYCKFCRMPLILNMRYLPLISIGRGGFGEAFCARDLHFSDYSCVVKILHPIQQLNPLQLEKVKNGFKKGANILRGLDHPQIPTIYDYFNLPAPDQKETLFYLVQDYIPGKTLDKELIEKIKRIVPNYQLGQILDEKVLKLVRYSETEVSDILKSLLEIISYTHQKGVLHRDIKPSNIIRHDDDGKLFLIDFDTAIKRELEADVCIEQSSVIGTDGYAPPEQLNGRGINDSADLYAIAATCVHLITAKSPLEIRQISYSPQLRETWREYAPNVDNQLANVLDRMLLYEPKLRYQSAQEILSGLKSPTAPGKAPLPQTKIIHRWPRWMVLSLLAVLVPIILLAIKYLTTPPACLKYSCETKDSFSWGEQILIESQNSQDKQKGTKAFKKNEIKLAIEHFRNHLKDNPNDPEALIYLNNAIAASTKNPVKIAAAVPIQTARKVSEETLRGIAQAQSEYNCGIDKIQNLIGNKDTELKCNNNQLLQIQIADQKNRTKDLQTVRDVAENLVRDESIVGVVGYSSSTSTAAAAEIHNDSKLGNKRLVLISPHSTVERESQNLNLYRYDYLFRPSSTDYTAVGDLVDYISNENLNKNDWKIAVIGDDTDYSKSFQKIFTDIFERKQIGEITELCKTSSNSDKCTIQNQNNQNIGNFLRQQKEKGADMILLALDFNTSKIAAKEVLLNSKMKMLGSDGVYHPGLLEALDKGRKIQLTQKQQLVVAVPWHRSKNTDKSEFEIDAKLLWGSGYINWRTAMAYDATQAIVNGLLLHQQNNKNTFTRKDLYDFLDTGLTPRSNSPGAAGTSIKFCPNGDRQLEAGIGVLVEVVQKSDGSRQKSEFSLLEKPERKIGENCQD